MTNTNYPTSIEDINSSYIKLELAPLGITHLRFLAEGGEGENHVSVWAFAGSDGIESRVINTNAEPIWEEGDPEDFADLIADLGIEL